MNAVRFASALDEMLVLRSENGRLRKALASAFCPGGGWTGQPKDIVQACVSDCLAHGVCGCSLGDALKGSPLPSPVRQEGS